MKTSKIAEDTLLWNLMSNENVGVHQQVIFPRYCLLFKNCVRQRRGFHFFFSKTLKYRYYFRLLVRPNVFLLVNCFSKSEF